MVRAEDSPYDIFSEIDLLGSIESVILLRRTGVILAAWSRNTIPQEVIAVMTATMVGSIETMLEAAGMPTPQSIIVRTDGNVILAHRVGARDILALIAPKQAREEYLRIVARRILAKVAANAASAQSVPKSPEVVTAP